VDELPGTPKPPRGWGTREQRKPDSAGVEVPPLQPAPPLEPVALGAVPPPYRAAGAGAGFVPAVYAPPSPAPAASGAGMHAPGWRVSSSAARRRGLRLAPVLGVLGGLGYLVVKVFLLHFLTGSGLADISHPRTLNIDDAGKCVLLDGNRMTGIVDCSQPHQGLIVNVVASGSECRTGPGVVAFVRSDLSGAAACVDTRQ